MVDNDDDSHDKGDDSKKNIHGPRIRCPHTLPRSQFSATRKKNGCTWYEKVRMMWLMAKILILRMIIAKKKYTWTGYFDAHTLPCSQFSATRKKKSLHSVGNVLHNIGIDEADKVDGNNDT